MASHITPQRIAQVQAACEQQAWLFAESGAQHGWVPVAYRPSLRHDSERIFGNVVRLWAAIDRPNAQILIIATPTSEAAFRRLKHTQVNAKLISAAEASANGWYL